MIINVVATHRFHLLDLARELKQCGHNVRFYSYITRKRVKRFGLSRNDSVCFLWLVFPYFLFSKLFPKNEKWQFFLVQKRNIVIDWYISHTMRKCDVLIALGCVYTQTIRSARKNGAITILEWGSKHIIDQLSSFGRLKVYPPYQLKKDLLDYETADYISIPASHVRDSFIKNGVDGDKLIVNPYGVDIYQFHPTECTNEYDLIFVGGWRYEKGVDLLINVCKMYGYSLLHVGALVNMSFPSEKNFVHIDPVDQSRLIEYYTRARVFVLPSRAEGLSLVQVQAISCGLPIVCSKETGGIDLRNQLSDNRWIIEMSDLNEESLHNCIEKALELASTQKGIRDYAMKDMVSFSWHSYGKRYNDFLQKIKHEATR